MTCILNIWRLTTYIYVIPQHLPKNIAFYIFIHQMLVMNILNMLPTFAYLLFKMQFVS